MPSEARPVTRNWLTNKELLARTPPDRHTKPYEPRPVTHARPAGTELPARGSDEQPAREAQILNTLPSGARPATYRHTQPSAARPVTRTRPAGNELPARGQPAREAQTQTTLPSGARPVTYQHTRPPEGRPVTHTTPASGELPARGAAEQPARKTQTLNPLPAGARPVTRSIWGDHPGKNKTPKTAAATPGAGPPGDRRRTSRKLDALPVPPPKPGTRGDNRTAGPCDHKA